MRMNAWLLPAAVLMQESVGRRIAPAVPEPGEHEWRAIGPADRVRLADRPFPAPLVEALDGDEATLSLEGVAKGWCAGERLGPRVEHPRPDLRTVGPVGDQSPAVRGHAATILALDDDEGFVGGRDVVARARIVDDRLGGEDLGELRRGTLLAEPAAHGGQV